MFWYFFLLSVPDTTESNEETRQLGIIVGSSVGGVVLIAALLVFLTCCVCLIVNWRIHADAKINRGLVEVSVAKLYKDKRPNVMKLELEDLEKDFKQQHELRKIHKSTKRVTDDGGDEDEEAQKQKILDKFIKDMHKRHR